MADKKKGLEQDCSFQNKQIQVFTVTAVTLEIINCTSKFHHSSTAKETYNKQICYL